MAQAQLAQDTNRQVQADCHTNVNADGNQLTGQGVGYMSARHKDLHDRKGNDDDAVCNHIAAGGFTDFLHSRHLTLSL